MKVGCIRRSLIQGARSTNKILKKVGTFFIIENFCGFIFKFVWAVYGGDLIGFCQSFRKVVLKNDQQQTKSKNLKNSQDMNRFDTLIRQLCPRAIQRV
jgi:hypothetical protein